MNSEDWLLSIAWLIGLARVWRSICCCCCCLYDWRASWDVFRSCYYYA